MTAAPDVPPPDEVTEPWWDATREHRLVVQRCDACGHHQHPPRAVCAACGSVEDLVWDESSGDGLVEAATVVERAPAPAFDPPYVVARVRLPERVVLLTNVVADDPYAVACDQPVRLDWHDLPDGRALPIFRLVDEKRS